MRYKGLIIRTGVPLPPAAGSARVIFVHNEGVASLRKSFRLYGQILLDIGIGQLGDINKLPEWVGFKNGPMTGRDKHVDNVETRLNWARVHEEINRRRARSRYPSLREFFDGFPSGPGWKCMEDAARQALQHAVDAFNFLEDDPLAEFSHIYAHQVAAFVCGIFGCTYLYEEDAYWDVCKISLMHSRVGSSMGFTCTRICSICNEDIDECPHLLDRQYPVIVEHDDDGRCTACGASECGHQDGEAVEVYPSAIFGPDMMLHEVSLVGRPRDPLARLEQVEVDTSIIRDIIGKRPNGQMFFCYRCLERCRGFRHTFEGSLTLA